MSLFSDYPQAIEAALDAQGHRGREPVMEARIRAAFTAALAALPRDALIEKAAWALTEGLPPTVKDRVDTRRILVAIGLIPEHDTATEER